MFVTVYVKEVWWSERSLENLSIVDKDVKKFTKIKVSFHLKNKNIVEPWDSILSTLCVIDFE